MTFTYHPSIYQSNRNDPISHLISISNDFAHFLLLTICELSLISEKSLFHGTVGTLPFFFSISLMLATKSARFLRAVVDKPVVKMPTSILPDNGSVADCFNASRCNLILGYRMEFHELFRISTKKRNSTKTKSSCRLNSHLHASSTSSI